MIPILCLAGGLAIAYTLPKVLPEKDFEVVAEGLFKAIEGLFSSFGFLLLVLTAIALTVVFWPAAVVLLLLVLVLR